MKCLVDKRTYDRIKDQYDRIAEGPKTEVEWLEYNMCVDDMSYHGPHCWCRYHTGTVQQRVLHLVTKQNTNGSTSYFVETSH